MPNNPAAEADPSRLLGSVGVALEAAGVKWAVVGAMAVAYHGWVRASLDADAVISLNGCSLDLDQLGGMLRSHGWEVEVRMGEKGDPIGFAMLIRDAVGNQADLISGIRRLDPAFFDRTIEENWDGMRLRVASVEDLIALKVFAGRPKDIEDVEGLLQIRGASIDKALTLKLCRGFGTQATKAWERIVIQSKA